MERALVLAAMDIDYDVRRSWWGWNLLVDESVAWNANSQLTLYEAENRPVVPPVGTDREGTGIRAGLFIYATVLLSVFLLQGNHGFGINWTDAGRVDVGAIRAGETWRTVTALTLHRDLWHLLSNLGFGAIFAALVARELGGGVAWFAILLAGACGNGLNALVQRPEHLAIGASTAVFGALGLFAAFSFFYGRLYRDTWARRWTPVVGGLWVLAWLGTGDARTDIVAHLTGFLAGFLLGGLMGRIPKPAGNDTALQWVAGLTALGIVIAAWGLAVT